WISRGRQHAGERHRYDARLDRPPEGIEELGAILHHHQQALPPAEPQVQQRVAASIHVLAERGIGDFAAAKADGDLRAAPFGHVTVDERHRDVEARRKRDRGGRTRAIEADPRIDHVIRFRSARAANSRAACLRQLMLKSVFWDGLATWAISSVASRKVSSSASFR